MARILVAEPIAAEGLDLLRTAGQVDVRTGLSPQQLAECIGEYDVLIVRSQTKVTAELIEAGKRLQVIGRAGVGVDNIDLQAATRGGIAVVNAPTGNIIATAEHTIALLLALARHVPQACASLKQGQWRRKDYVGVQLRDKVLGIVGLGKVGSEVAKRVRSLEMRILAYDPFVSESYARSLGVELATKEDVLTRADFITLHTPLTEATRKLIGKAELAMMKPTAFLINAARGPLVDEDALLDAVQSGKLAGAALDVFSREPLTESPLFGSERIIVTPHLAASTTEAQQEVSREIAEQVLLVLRGQPARHVVNVPFLPPETHAVVAPFVEVAAKVGSLAAQLCEGQLGTITLRYEGEIAEHDTSILKAGALVGILGPVSEERVNLVNANLIASQRGLKVVESKGGTSEHYTNLLTVELATSQGITVVAGTSVRGESHVVRIDSYWLDFVPAEGYLLVIDHRDRPGMIGAVGSVTGAHDINISFMEVGRLEPRGHAIMVLGLDDPVPEDVLEEIRAIPGIDSAKVVTV